MTKVDILSQFTPDMAPPSSRWMGMNLVEHEPDKMFTKVTFESNDDMINFGGVIQGGFLSAMMDDAIGFNTFISLKMQYSMATIDLNTQFFQAAKPGTLTVEARVTRAGKNIVFAEAKLYDDQNQLLAAMTSSLKLRPFKGMQYNMENSNG